MADEVPIAPTGERLTAAVKRISWGAIFAGVVAALAAQLLLGILGIAIGAGVINPMDQQNPSAGLGIGAIIWLFVTTALALYAGGWVAGRLAGMPARIDSGLHGVLAWSLTTLLTFWLLTTTAGALIGGAASVLGQGLSLVGRCVAAASPAVAGAVSNELEKNGVNVDSIRQEARTLLRQTGKPALQPGQLGSEAQATREAARSSAERAARNPQAADQELDSVLDRIAASGQKTIQAADRQALENILVARTDMTHAEASNTVDRWAVTYQQAAQQFDQMKAAAAQQARETGAATASAVSKTALWSFVILLIGAVVAAYGGMAGAPRDIAVVTRPIPA